MNRMMVQLIPPGKSIGKMMKKPQRRARQKRSTSPRLNFSQFPTIKKPSIGTSEGSLSIRKPENRARKSITVLDVHGMEKAKQARDEKKPICKSYTDLTYSGRAVNDSPQDQDYGVILESQIINQDIPKFANLSPEEGPSIDEESPHHDHR